MSYTCIADATTNKASSYLNDYWYEGKSKALVPPAHLGLVPASLVTHTFDAVIGVFAGLGLIFTAASVDSIGEFAVKHLISGDCLLGNTCLNLILTLNPGFRFEKQEKLGVVLPFMLKPLGEFADNCAASNNSIKRHVLSRLTYLLLTIASIVAKVVDTIIGILAFTLALLAVGRWKQINNFAINTLSSPGFAALFCGLALTIRGKKGN